jgi:hypothetical protein
MPTFDASTNPERIPFVDVLMALCDLAQAGGVQIMLVGATARDIALAAEGHDAPLRATNDVDIAVVVADAAAFERLVADLAAVPGGGAHKFRVNGIDVDIVPFGGIEREDRTVIWPDGSTMNTLGFTESLESALKLLLAGKRRMPGCVKDEQAWALRHRQPTRSRTGPELAHDLAPTSSCPRIVRARNRAHHLDVVRSADSEDGDVIVRGTAADHGVHDFAADGVWLVGVHSTAEEIELFFE